MSAALAPLAFVDCETTGLDPDRHEVWEVAIVSPSGDDVILLEVNLARADLGALNIGGYRERHSSIKCTEARTAARTIARMTWGCHLVGAVPSFDAAFLGRLLRRNGECPGWHYQLIDVETLIAGRLGIAPPWESDDLSRQVGVNPEHYERHTARGDALWAKALYEAVMGPIPAPAP